MQAKQHSGAKRIPCPSRAGDEFLRQFDGGLPEILAGAGAGKTAFGEMDDHQFAHPGLQEHPGGMPQRHRVIALCAPVRLWLAGEGAAAPEVAQAIYAKADAAANLSTFNGDRSQTRAAALDWLLK